MISNIEYYALFGKMLEVIAFEFINHHRAVLVKNSKLLVSSIYNRYKADFGGTDVSVIDHLRHYAKPPLADQPSNIESIDNDDHYDWALTA